ncbi:MAG TPA: methyltransferase [Amycolatopsis sp.]|uniref:methyltransferase n=1 Tax=Amycolatopsis sp. TaxID=37632 RepID=UPI002B483AF1|nr:methyltransferase [Amycolatopsis sp.]HKS50118.1 methyltransferase [Amycolatopsis sp.]
METRDLEFLIGKNIIDKYRSDAGRPSVFEWVGREWNLLDEVWPPSYSPGGELFADLIPFGEMSSFLEMGCGVGIMSVLAALAGCPSVLALDINPAAVENTMLNAARHGVAARITARESDLYSAVKPGERFDGIYWNPPFLDAPPDALDSSIWHETMFDPEYAKLRRFLREGRELLAPDGRIYLWFGEAFGNPTLIRDLAAETDLDLNVLKDLQLSAVPEALADAFPAFMLDAAQSTEWHLHLLELKAR